MRPWRISSVMAFGCVTFALVFIIYFVSDVGMRIKMVYFTQVNPKAYFILPKEHESYLDFLPDAVVLTLRFDSGG